MRRENLGCALVRTAHGDTEISKLKAGDVIVTSAHERRVSRVESNTINCREHPEPERVRPIRIAAQAFGENRPSRDVLVSPSSAVCVNILGELLVDARSLINGLSVEQIDVDEVDTWSVELDHQDIIFVENMGLESYPASSEPRQKLAEISTFENDDVTLPLGAGHCRPYYRGGPMVEAVRGQMRKRLPLIGWGLVDTLEVHLEADGRRLEATMSGFAARFHMPAGAKDVWLVSPGTRPSETTGSPDDRLLGVCVIALRIEDGFSAPRDIPSEDPSLSVGFYDVEDAARRWTTGRAQLPKSLWSDRDHDFFLCVHLAGLPAQRWQRLVPGDVADALLGPNGAQAASNLSRRAGSGEPSLVIAS